MVKSFFYFLLIANYSFCLNNKADSTIMSGVRAFYNYDFDRSIEILDKSRIDFPDHPGVHFIWASSKYYVSQGLDPIDATYDTLAIVLNEIQPIYNNLIDKYPNNFEYKLYLGSTLGMKARSSLGKKDWISVLAQSYRGFRIIEKVAEDKPNLIDAQLPIGIVGYYASISNALIRWLINIYGLDTSKKSALTKIENSALNSDWAWIEASGIISFIYLWIENVPEKALRFTTRLSNEFPNNFYFQILYLESLTRTLKIDKANMLIKKLNFDYENLSLRQKEWYKPYFDYQKALLSFHEKDYNQSRMLADLAINDYAGELDIILGNLFLLIGKLNDISGERNTAIKYYKLCRDLDNFSYASKQSREYLEKPYLLK